MKREVELYRWILLDVEEHDEGCIGSPRSQIRTIQHPDRSDAVLAEHADHLIEQGLVEGKSIDGGLSDIRVVLIKGLTSSGHDFIDGFREERFFKRAKAALTGAGKEVSLATMAEVVKRGVGYLPSLFG